MRQRQSRPTGTLDPDRTRRDDAPYWAAALVLAIRAGDARRVSLAERELGRLGVPLTTAAGASAGHVGRGARQ